MLQSSLELIDNFVTYAYFLSNEYIHTYILLLSTYIYIYMNTVYSCMSKYIYIYKFVYIYIYMYI